MLMRDFGERSLDGEPITRWQAANRAFATIQVGCSADLEPWWRPGCPDLPIPVCDHTRWLATFGRRVPSLALRRLVPIRPLLHFLD
jgi:hypothetical protein